MRSMVEGSFGRDADNPSTALRAVQFGRFLLRPGDGASAELPSNRWGGSLGSQHRTHQK
jgi:hypothetical protein